MVESMLMDLSRADKKSTTISWYLHWSRPSMTTNVYSSMGDFLRGSTIISRN